MKTLKKAKLIHFLVRESSFEFPCICDSARCSSNKYLGAMMPFSAASLDVVKVQAS